jgi:hypothetical protein
MIRNDPDRSLDGMCVHARSGYSAWQPDGGAWLP